MLEWQSQKYKFQRIHVYNFVLMTEREVNDYGPVERKKTVKLINGF